MNESSIHGGCLCGAVTSGRLAGYSNIIAGVRYAVERYGSVSNVPGIQGLNKGQGYVGY